MINPARTNNHPRSRLHAVRRTCWRPRLQVSPCIILVAQVPLLDCTFTVFLTICHKRFECTSTCRSTDFSQCHLVLVHILVHAYLSALKAPEVSICIIRARSGPGLIPSFLAPRSCIFADEKPHFFSWRIVPDILDRPCCDSDRFVLGFVL